MNLLAKQPFCLDDIRDAERRMKGICTLTPVMTSRRMDAKAGCNLFFKCELLQRTGSFKIRGAVNFLSKLKEKSKGGPLPCVTTQSSGNFAQGLALASKILGFKAYVVMPETSPPCKLSAVKEYGAEIILCEPTLKGLYGGKDAVVREMGAVYAPSSEHYDIMVGQGTMCTELIQQVIVGHTLFMLGVAGVTLNLRFDSGRENFYGKSTGSPHSKINLAQNTNNNLDIIVVPVGGGGMLSGVAVAAKTLCPGIKVIAAEPELADDCYQSFVARKYVKQEGYKTGTVADGLRINLAQIAWPIVRDLVDDVITVTDEEIKEGTRLVWKNMKLCIEPSAGVGVAAVMSEKFKSKYGGTKKVGVILCGGNYDIDSVKTWI